MAWHSNGFDKGREERRRGEREGRGGRGRGKEKRGCEGRGGDEGGEERQAKERKQLLSDHSASCCVYKGNPKQQEKDTKGGAKVVKLVCYLWHIHGVLARMYWEVWRTHYSYLVEFLQILNLEIDRKCMFNKSLSTSKFKNFSAFSFTYLLRLRLQCEHQSYWISWSAF